MSLVRVRDLVVEFPIYGTPATRSLKKAVMRAATGGILARDAGERIVVRALNGVSFDLTVGDRVGLIGHNGSGKSTLLRVLAGVYAPVSGSAEVTGRVASMLSITLGMDTEATGYENIFLRGAIMGLRRREIEPLIPSIVEFSELGDYLEMPLRTYSSGMAMRLAFSISTSISADILLMDEWLSVGDEDFAHKAQGRLQEMVGRAKILVIASHDLSLVRSLCNKEIRLDHGEIKSIEPSVAREIGTADTANV